jgi:3-oxoacyl-[acyl-carrier protein] reductase
MASGVPAAARGRMPSPQSPDKKSLKLLKSACRHLSSISCKLQVHFGDTENMDFGLKNKKALVCGASKGLGYACAAALAAEGASLYLLGRTAKSLEAAAEDMRKLGSVDVRIAQCDLLSQNARRHTIEKVRSDWGHLDILIHNVGGPKPSTAYETTLDAWQEGFERLFLPVVDFNSAFLPAMKEKNWGRIVTVTSLAVTEPIAMLAVSNALRSASTSMSKTLSDEVASYGVTVNCVAPGMIHTDRLEELMQARKEKSGQSRDDYESELFKSIPAGRLGRPEEYGAAVCFLCSNQASYISGSTIYVDGGKRRSTY